MFYSILIKKTKSLASQKPWGKIKSSLNLTIHKNSATIAPYLMPVFDPKYMQNNELREIHNIQGEINKTTLAIMILAPILSALIVKLFF